MHTQSAVEGVPGSLCCANSQLLTARTPESRRSRSEHAVRARPARASAPVASRGCLAGAPAPGPGVGEMHGSEVIEIRDE
ncbi:hypothetical protein [Streptomyces sp. NBC_01166]|uniref:hypothetical protein n=1 Tax=Streptomyces sp. NBC_01166 TaxID=2903755 RepID=UPI00386872D8